jgi:hypothetical protein
LSTIGILIPFAMAITFHEQLHLPHPVTTLWGPQLVPHVPGQPVLERRGVTLQYGSGPRWWRCCWPGIASCWATSTTGFSRILRVALIFPLMVAPVFGPIIWQMCCPPPWASLRNS